MSLYFIYKSYFTFPSTFYSHYNINLFQWVKYIFHKYEKGYFAHVPLFFRNQTVDLFKFFCSQTVDRLKKTVLCSKITFLSPLSRNKTLYFEGFVNNLMKWLCIAGDSFSYSQKVYFFPLVYTQSINICLCYRFHRLALL